MMIRGMSTTLRLRTLVLAVLVLGLAAPVWANTVEVFPASPIPSTTTDWISNLTFPQFDPSLGTLTEVQLTLSGSLTTDLNIVNSAESASSGNAKTEVADFPPGPGGRSCFLPAFSANRRLFAGVCLFLGGRRQHRFGHAWGSRSLRATTTRLRAVLSDFTGGGTIALSASTFTQTDVSNTGGNTSASQMTEASLTGSVTYYYNPPLPATPEPSTLALLAVGALGLVGYGWRRRAV